MRTSAPLTVKMPGVGDRPPHPRWTLTQLLDVNVLQAIQDTFARSFGLPTSIVDADGANLTAITNRVRFCEDLTRASQRGGPRCLECDLGAMARAADTHDPFIFECWNGVYDCAIPIEVKGEPVGYFLVGQVFSEAPDALRYRETAAELGVEPDDYVDALQEVRIVPHDRYDAAVRSMHKLAQLIAEQAAAAIDNLEMLEEAKRAQAATGQLMEELETVLEGLREVTLRPDYHSTLEAIADTLERLIPHDSCVIYLADDGDLLSPVVVRDAYPEPLRAHRIRKGEGIFGEVASSRVARRIDDVTQAPGFTPVPGLPIEPESVLLAPMVYKERLLGLIALGRLERRTFTEHELRLLTVHSGQAAVAVMLAQLVAEKAHGLEHEQLWARLREATTAPRSADVLLDEITRIGMELLGADAALVRLDADAATPRTAVVGMARPRAEALLAEIPDPRDGADGDGLAHALRAGDLHLLRLPLEAGERVGVALFVRSRNPDGEWDLPLATSFAKRASIGLGFVSMRERERQRLRQSQQLQELTSELVKSRDDAQARSVLLSRTTDVLACGTCCIATVEERPEACVVELRRGRETEMLSLNLQGRARVAALRLRTEPAFDRALFDAWADEVVAEVGARAGAGLTLVAPLVVAERFLGGLFAGGPQEPGSSDEQGRLLGMIADAGAAVLARFAAQLETDSSLAARMRELQALAQLAQRITGLTSEEAIVGRLLSDFRNVGGFESAFYVSEKGRVVPERGCGLTAEAAAEMAARLPAEELAAGGVAADLSGDRQLFALPVRYEEGEEARLVGAGAAPRDAQRERVLVTLVGYGAVALGRARLHDRRRAAIARLERANEELAEQRQTLERILDAHNRLTDAVLEGRGLPAAARSLGEFVDGEILIATPQGRTLAVWPQDISIEWRPEPDVDPPRIVSSVVDGAHLTAAPGIVDGELLAWLVARTRRPPGEIERAGFEYGAVLAALEVMREQTALDVEARLRGDVLEELFSGDFVEELVLRRAQALGFDLTRPARVYVVEPSDDGGRSRQSGSGSPAPHRIYRMVAEVAESWGESLVAPRGEGVVALVHEEPEQEMARPLVFEEQLKRICAARMPHVAMTIAAGPICDQLADFRRSHIAARRAVDLLHLLGRTGEVFSFRAPGVEHMLLEADAPEALLAFMRNYVEPLERYDRDHSSELLVTLAACFETGFNLERTARGLHVHVSTLRYRLKRAGELLGVDLRDPEVRLNVQVALRAARALAVYRS